MVEDVKIIYKQLCSIDKISYIKTPYQIRELASENPEKFLKVFGSSDI